MTLVADHADDLERRLSRCTDPHLSAERILGSEHLLRQQPIDHGHAIASCCVFGCEGAARNQRHADRFEITLGDPRDVGVLRGGRIRRRTIEAYEARALPVVCNRHGIDQSGSVDAWSCLRLDNS